MNLDLIRMIPLFADLSGEEQESLADSFAQLHLEQGETLFDAGDRSEALFVIERGYVSIVGRDGQNLATLGPGSIVGEASLFRHENHEVGATAATALDYLNLSNAQLRNLILRQPSIGIKLSNRFGALLAQMEDYLVARLAKTDELNRLPQHTLQAVASRLKSYPIAAGQALFKAGDAPRGLFLVEEGAVELRPETSIVDEDVQTIAPGEIIGTLALLTNKPYTHTAVALEPTLLWSLTSEQFQQLNTEHPALRRSLGRNVRARLSTSDQAKAVARLSQMPLFAELSPQTMQAIVQRMILQHVPAGERVYHIGEPGDALYLIENGEIDLRAQNANGALEELARVGPNGFFGEMSLLTGKIRTEDATALRHANLWVLYKSDLDALVADHPAIGTALSQGVATRLAAEEQNSDIERFRSFALLGGLDDDQLRQVVRYLRPTRYRAGEQIVRASTPGEALFLIDRGQVRAQPMNGGGWILDAGESFGERALITNQPHNLGVTAETDVDLWVLSKADFDVLVGRYPNLALSLSRMLSQRVGQTGEFAPVAGAGYEPSGYPQAGYDQPGYAPQPYITPDDEAAYSPAARRRRRASAGREGGRRGFGGWFGNLSATGKLLFVTLILLAIILVGVTAPFAVMNYMQTGSFMGANGFYSALNSVYSVGSWELARLDQGAVQALALADSQVPATATWTPRPTQTSAPTSTPLPTGTPPPTAAALARAPAFIPAPVAVAQAAPVAEIAEEQPEAEPMVAAAAPPRAWDGRLDRLGVRVDEAPASPGQPYWRLIEARWADEQESQGRHHIYVEVLDENGSRVANHPVRVSWAEGNTIGQTENKPAPEYPFNFQMFAAGNSYSVSIEGLPSDKIVGVGLGDLDKPTWTVHTSVYLVYQRAVK